MGPMGLATNGLHGPAKAREDGEARDVREGEPEGPRGEGELPEAAEEGGGDCRPREPRRVHRDQRRGDGPLLSELGNYRLFGLRSPCWWCCSVVLFLVGYREWHGVCGCV